VSLSQGWAARRRQARSRRSGRTGALRCAQHLAPAGPPTRTRCAVLALLAGAVTWVIERPLCGIQPLHFAGYRAVATDPTTVQIARFGRCWCAGGLLRLLAASLQRLPIEMTRATFPVATSTSWTKTLPLGPTDQGEQVITIEHHGLGRPSGTKSEKSELGSSNIWLTLPGLVV
jgi:hypothetical protein